MKLDFNCTICINKSGELFLLFFSIDDINSHEWDFDLHFKSLSDEREKE